MKGTAIKREFCIGSFLLISTSIALASWFDTGWTTFTQPNGVTFTARMYGDEYEYHFETREGFSLDKNYADGYYYYARAAGKTRFILTQLRVGVDEPMGVPRHLTVVRGTRPIYPLQSVKDADSGTILRKTSVRTIMLKVLLIEFQDVRGRLSYTKTDFRNLLMADNYVVSPDGEAAFGSIKYYYERMSNGQLIVNATVLNNVSGGDTPNWVRLPHTKIEYDNGTFSFYDDAYAAGVAAGYDLSRTDDSWPVFIYAGNFYTGALTPRAEFDRYYRYYQMSEIWGGRGQYNNEDPSYTFAHIGVHCHEFGHTLGFEDIYFYGHLDWTLMADGCDMGPTLPPKGQSPAPIDPHFRYLMNWITVKTPGVPNSGVSLTYNEVTPDVYRVQSGDDIYYIENRRYQNFGLYCPGYGQGSGGVLVWHSKYMGYYWKTDLIQADGTGWQQEAEGLGDMWPGSTGNRNLNDFTAPNSAKFDGGGNSNVIVHYVSDPGATMTAIIGDKWFGNSPLSSTWSGEVIVGANLTIPLGLTLTVQAGSLVKSDPGTSLTVNGALNATSATFTSTSPSTTWSGIYFASGSNGSINGCAISNVNAYSGAAITINNASPTIQNSTIENNTGVCDGIAEVSGASAYLYHNTIRNNSRHGVYIYQSSPTLIQNNITATTTSGNAAVSCAFYSSPVLGHLYNTIEGRNTLTNGWYGLYVSTNSNPLLGSPSNPSFKNRLFGNSYADAYAEQTSTVYAQYAWWGQSPPNTARIIATTGSVIYYDPWLTADPGAAFRIGEPASPILSPILSVQSVNGGSPASGADLRALLLQAREHRLKNEHATAVAIYKAILASASGSDEAKIALVEMGSVYQEIKDKTVLQYIESFTQRPNSFRATALELLANSYAVDGNATAASVVNTTLVNDFAGTIHEKHGRMNQFFSSFNLKQYASAREQLAQLTAKHPTDEAVMLASWLMQIVGEGSPGASQQQVAQTTQFQATPQLGVANYPNPFNPTTIIHFTLPQSGVVSLKVFDMLGREVATLVNEYHPAGSHQVNFNGSSLTSGVYFYKVESAGSTAMQKMLLVK